MNISSNKKQKKVETNKNIKTFGQHLDSRYGKTGTETRTNFEIKAKSFAIGELIKEERKLAHLTQEQLGQMVGVQKAQISKLENNFTNARFDTVIKVFNALNAKVNFKVELSKQKLSIA